MNAELAAHADLQLQAMALVDAFREHRDADRDYLINQSDVGDLMTGLALYAMKLECALARGWDMAPATLRSTLRQIFTEQASA